MGNTNNKITKNETADKGPLKILIIILTLAAALISIHFAYRDYIDTVSEPDPRGKSGSTQKTEGELNIFDACDQGKLERVKEILAKEPEAINKLDETGKTPLHCALAAGKTDIIKHLIQSGATINVPDKDGNSDILFALFGCDPPTLEYLVENGIDINSKNNNGLSALHAAVISEKPESVEFVLSRGFDINIQDNQGATALTLAVINEKPSTARLLLSRGADPAIKDTYGFTSADYAKSSQNDEIVKIFESLR